ncbi:hypothetical protein BASA50_000417 [Batrachochytrium salamandrivorans]|uniref:CNH domain-containing protein n=1 Tax=Batrachochytrium salamandrivorans TaxID=1357716 RepID=A0ABQ8ETR6_9FUNG|nr:hypothetical protein BASA60_008577 [Batrachochytrium salamandrivorans]KAH6581988.1 hypothetical protein BASA61_008735 [Batrachochytrium salamandrivorans]KAH6586462.1 hypothetical protein BASA50_000417 [Batrachochytrium salamandrivorans]KAH9275471.1 hypothetical protein BASA83_002245 [Batrachochytrium salamandrivorans]
MYEVLHPQPVVEEFPLRIQCISSWGTKLFIGTSDGAILAYEVEDEPSFTITLVEVSKNFSKRSIDGIAVLPSSKSLVVLSDSSLIVCDYGSLSVTSPLSKTKGCSAIQAHRTPPDSSPTTHDLFAAIVRKSIMVFTVSQYEVIHLKEIKLSHIPSSLIWCNSNSIVSTIVGGALHIDIEVGIASPIPILDHLGTPATSRTYSPYILVDSSGDSFFLTAHDTSYRFDLLTGSLERLFSWSAPPSHVVYEDYYLAALMAYQIEVRSVKSGQVLQLISMQNCTVLFSGHLIFAASFCNVWRLLPLDFEDQIDELVFANRFSDALKFIDELEFSQAADKASNITKVLALQAHHMFTEEKKYESALEILESLNASPLDVLDLFPALFDVEVDWTAPPSERDAVNAIAGYLLRERARLSKHRSTLSYAVQDTPQSSIRVPLLTRLPETDELSESNVLGYDDICHLQIIIDTSLLKAYLALNSPLLRSLVRVENYCDLVTAEALFSKTERFDAMIDLYFTKKLHSKAIEWLVAHTKEDGSVDAIVQYLKRLKLSESISYIFQYAPLVIAKDPELGLSVFTEDRDNLSQDNRIRVYEFLGTCSPQLALRYLEHAVFVLSDTSRSFHNELAFSYLKLIKSHTGPKELPLESKLADFLRGSSSYDPDAVLLRMPSEGLLNVRAIIYGRLKRHKEAISIYITKLCNFKLACSYCEDQYDADNSESAEVFTILLELLMQDSSRTLKDNLEFLSIYACKLNATTTLRLLQPDIALSVLEKFLYKSHDTLIDAKNMNIVRTSMLRAERIQLQKQLISLQSRRVYISDENMCKICLKRISNAMLAQFLDGSMAHAYCVR